MVPHANGIRVNRPLIRGQNPFSPSKKPLGEKALDG